MGNLEQRVDHNFQESVQDDGSRVCICVNEKNGNLCRKPKNQFDSDGIRCTYRRFRWEKAALMAVAAVGTIAGPVKF